MKYDIIDKITNFFIGKIIHQANIIYEMILGIGTDIVEVQRIRKSIESRNGLFKNRVFTTAEQVYCNKHKDPFPRFAGRFAAKEAFIKALSKKARLNLNEIETLNDPSGKPYINTKGRISEILTKQGIKDIHVSISHEKNYAIAVVVLQSR